MIIKNVELEMVLGPTSKLPVTTLPEIAFAGKSNVGKSSLINAMINRKSLARTSSQPGKTQTINFYNINKELYFVDLPGYGFAKVSKDAQAKWGALIEKYLRTSKQLKSVFLLIDIRNGAKAHDKEMYDWIIYNGYQPIIIATKADKISRNQIPRQLKIIREGLGIGTDVRMIPFSSETKQGRDEVWALIGELMDESPKSEK
ncbi:MAG: ribosome biogenesis GTP-binding protein YihA/YsxC [Lachnospiraceae bacterium]|nr:ribosome biogenesis GTP-binding protein YihA/YsxC [Lachnospiraceae bacterium]